MSDLTVATLIFVAAYGVIVSERLDRVVVALAGAAVMLLVGILDQEEAIAAIDFNTLALLVGMMIQVNILRRTGLFRYLGWRTAIALGGNPWSMLLGFALFTAVASAFLDNVTTVLLMIPVSITVADDLGLSSRPFLISQVIASNVGGTATLIGDPPNILIGSATGLDFVQFLVHLAPIVVVLLGLLVVGFWLVYHRRGAIGIPGEEARAALIRADAREHLRDPRLLRVAGVALAITMLGFFLHGALHLETGTVAMVGGIVALLLSRLEPHAILAEIEWPTLFFFAGLFVLVGGLESAGLLDRVARRAVDLTDGNATLTALGLLWLAGIVSAIVDNIPAVTTLIPLTFAVARLLHPELAGLGDAALAADPAVMPLWWALALGACLGGNGSLVGASANVVAAGIADRRKEPIGFWGFAKIGAPFTIVSLAVSSLYVWLRYLAF